MRPRPKGIRPRNSPRPKLGKPSPLARPRPVPKLQSSSLPSPEGVVEEKDDSTDSVYLCRAYFVNGSPPKEWRERNYALKDPPVSGFAPVLVHDGPAGSKIIFHIATLSAHRVSPDCGEIRGAERLPFQASMIRRTIVESVNRFRRQRRQFSMSAVRRVLNTIPDTRPRMRSKTV